MNANLGFDHVKVMGGGEAERTLLDSAARINHRLRRFAGANALKKIALNVIAKVRIHVLSAQDFAMCHLSKMRNSSSAATPLSLLYSVAMFHVQPARRRLHPSAVYVRALAGCGGRR